MYVSISVKDKTYQQDVDSKELLKMLKPLKMDEGIRGLSVSKDYMGTEYLCMLQVHYSDRIEYLGVVFCVASELPLLEECLDNIHL